MTERKNERKNITEELYKVADLIELLNERNYKDARELAIKIDLGEEIIQTITTREIFNELISSLRGLNVAIDLAMEYGLSYLQKLLAVYGLIEAMNIYYARKGKGNERFEYSELEAIYKFLETIENIAKKTCLAYEEQYTISIATNVSKIIYEELKKRGLYREALDFAKRFEFFLGDEPIRESLDLVYRRHKEQEPSQKPTKFKRVIKLLKEIF